MRQVKYLFVSLAIAFLAACGGGMTGDRAPVDRDPDRAATNSGPPTKLAFTTQPTNATLRAALSPAVTVAIQDAAGATVTSATSEVTLALASNPGGATLSGTTTITAVNGIATFANLRVDRLATGYTLAATSGPLTGVTSDAFDVTLAPVRVQLRAGWLHTCGLTTAGAPYCWGDNYYNQLGDGTTTQRTSPVAVLGGLRFAAVSGGEFHTCGVTTAGTAYCWGSNLYGELGNGTTTDVTIPVAVSGALSFAAVSAGVSHTCGLTTAGALYCWGRNDAGQLGNGTTIQQTRPAAVLGGHSFVAVSAGGSSSNADGSHSCGVTTAGAAYCWGSNYYGQLGNGTTTDRTTPGAVAGGHRFAAVSAGQDHTCGVTTAGPARDERVGASVPYCWGSNFFGQLGDGTTVHRSNPVEVLGGLSFATP